MNVVKDAKKSIFFMLLNITAIMLMLSACSSPNNEVDSSTNEGTINLSYATFPPPGTFPNIQMNKWAEELELRTDGQVEVDPFVGGSLLEASNMLDGVSAGVSDIGLTATTYEPGRFPLLEIAEAPSGYQDAEISSQVVNDLIEEFSPDSLEDFKVVTSFATDPSYIQSINPISSLEDIEGEQLRISGGVSSVLEDLGASPVGLPQDQVPESMQTRVIDGNVSSREILMDMNLANQAGYVTDYPLTITIFVVVMNQQVWEELPDDTKEVIDELNKEMSLFTGQYLDGHIEEAMEWGEESEGVEILSLDDGEEERWDNAIEGMQEDRVRRAEEQGLPGEEFQERLYELIEKYSE
ncbi:TRAP transporter substrate-binding protein [Salicibibacter cibarius]|uniref:TRAP transporter substrate-binding protein n=2 Tax=Salicibibacter cibarius TaxID=2743000 RepID=A0A7T6YZV5_9BACI|nr:TRAP transporter substrate-binding protein [Salicibibacter cibarius]